MMKSGSTASLPDRMPRSVLSWDSRKRCMPSTIEIIKCKVMAVAFTAYAVDGHVENGGDGLKLGFFRVQLAWVAAKRVRKSRRDEFGMTAKF